MENIKLSKIVQNLVKIHKKNVQNYRHVTKMMIYLNTNCMQNIQRIPKCVLLPQFFCAKRIKKRKGERRLQQPCQS